MGNLTVKESGEMVNFISPNVSKITSFKVHFSPRQEGSGDPSPENVREITGWNGVEGYGSGKNIGRVFGYTATNLSDTTNITVYQTTNNYGTTISTTTFNLPDTELVVTQSQATEPTSLSSYRNGYIVIGINNLIFEQTYNISFKISNITNNLLDTTLDKIRLLNPYGSPYTVSEIVDDRVIFKNVLFRERTATPDRKSFEIRICGFSFTLSEFMVTSVDNEDFTYEPYQGTELNINWTNNIKQWTYTDSSFDTYSYNIFNGYKNSLWDNAITDIPVEWFGKSLTYSVYIDRAESPYNSYDNARVWFYDDSSVTMQEAKRPCRITEPSSSGRSWVTFTIPEGTTKLALGLNISKGGRAYNPQLEYGEEPTEYQPYVGEMYGGYIDLVSGEIYKGFEQIIFNGNTKFSGINKYEDKTRFIYNKTLLTLPIKNNGMCYFNYYTNKNSALINNGFIGSTGNILIYTDTSINSINLLTEYQTNNPLQSVYELETPVYIATLTPQQLSTLKGQNNFWSNADYVEIEYELTETFDIQKAKRKIILNQPHVESTSGTIAKPETDMIGKIKECKIHFMPVQQSDSDPTPDNIAPITGWTGIDVYQAFVEYPITPMVQNRKVYGVKWVVDNDGLMTAYGTPTAFTGATLGEIDVNGDETLYGIIAGSLNNATFHKPTLLDSNNNSVAYTASDVILGTGLDLSLYNDIKKVRILIKRDGNVFMSGSCNAIVWKDKKPTISTTTVDWTNVAGTVYGGYVDLVSGELVAEYECMTDTWGNWGTLSDCEDGTELRYKRFTNAIVGNSAGSGVSYCNVAKYRYQNANGEIHFYNVTSSNNCRIYLPSGTDESLQIQAVGKLAEPIHYQLTPQQLTALRGTNNIWSNANGEIEIKYWTH